MTSALPRAQDPKRPVAPAGRGRRSTGRTAAAAVTRAPGAPAASVARAVRAALTGHDRDLRHAVGGREKRPRQSRHVGDLKRARKYAQRARVLGLARALLDQSPRQAAACAVVAASARFGITAVMVGKRIRALQQRLGAKLLTRTTRHQSLTEIGRQYYPLLPDPRGSAARRGRGRHPAPRAGRRSEVAATRAARLQAARARLRRRATTLSAAPGCRGARSRPASDRSPRAAPAHSPASPTPGHRAAAPRSAARTRRAF